LKRLTRHESGKRRLQRHCLGTEDRTAAIPRRAQASEALNKLPQRLAMRRRRIDRAQNLGIARRRDREIMVEIRGVEADRRRVEAQSDLALLKDRAVLVAKHGQQHLAGEVRSRPAPINVEEIGVRR
jgi:hypothetical protein